jgi:glycosyltransferase involved in cell wall biosynthesis
MPAVSVIIPAYNRPAFLAEALNSVAAQTFRDFEVIVIDDGSSEDLAPTVKPHSAFARLVRQEHGGPAVARNHGLRLASADIVAFLDSDDLWLPQKLERFGAAMGSKRDTRIFYGPMLPMEEHGDLVDGRTKPRHAGDITQPLFKSCFVDIPTVVCRKDVLTGAGGFDESLSVCEDYDLWLRVSLKDSFGFIEEPLAKRRLHAQRLSKADMPQNLAVKARMLERFWNRPEARKKIDPQVAAARLGRVYYSAARSSFRSGLFSQATDQARCARQFRGAPWRAIPLDWCSTICAMLRPNNQCEPGRLGPVA